MFYAVNANDSSIPEDDLIFNDMEDANAALRKHKGSRMKAFKEREKALTFVRGEELITSMDQLSISEPKSDEASTSVSLPSVTTSQLGQLRRKIEAGSYEDVENLIWSNPRYLVTVCDSAVYLMAGPKYNACHIAARSNKPEILALILDTVSNASYLKKMYPDESDSNLQERINHLLDSYLNTPDPRQGNTPLHFACKLGHYRVVKILLTFEGCALNLRDSDSKTAEESICDKMIVPTVSSNDDEDDDGDDVNNANKVNQEEAQAKIKTEIEAKKKKIKNLFKQQLDLPLYRDQLKKKLLLERRRSRSGIDSDTSFEDSFRSLDLNKDS